MNLYAKLLGPRTFDRSRLASIEKKIEELKNEPFVSELDFSVKEQEIDTAIKMMKKNKAIGIDHIASEMIIASADIMLPIYQRLFNAILNTTHYPILWKRGIMVTSINLGIHMIQITTGDRDRFMSGEVIQYNRLNRFISDRNEIGKEQIGFKKGTH